MKPSIAFLRSAPIFKSWYFASKIKTFGTWKMIDCVMSSLNVINLRFWNVSIENYRKDFEKAAWIMEVFQLKRLYLIMKTKVFKKISKWRWICSINYLFDWISYSKLENCEQLFYKGYCKVSTFLSAQPF